MEFYKFMKRFRFLIILSLIIISVPQTAFAYIDPSTGSMVVQIIIAAFAAVGYTVKVYWEKIKVLFKQVFKRTK